MAKLGEVIESRENEKVIEYISWYRRIGSRKYRFYVVKRNGVIEHIEVFAATGRPMWTRVHEFGKKNGK